MKSEQSSLKSYVVVPTPVVATAAAVVLFCLFLMNLLIHKCSVGIPIPEIHEKEDEICELLLSLVPASLETLPV